MTVIVPPETLTSAGRVRWVLDHLFAGNQREMARTVGVSQASLSRVVRGAQEPGRQLLVAVATDPRLDEAWLYTGHGGPLRGPLPETQPGGTTAATLPVARVILPGPPADHPGLLSAAGVPAADAFYRPSRYWLEVRPDDPIAGHVGERVGPGDLLLMEADAAVWGANRAVLGGKLCGVRLGGRGGPVYALARASRGAPGTALTFETFGVEEALRGAPTETSSLPPSTLRVRDRGAGRKSKGMDFFPDVESRSVQREAAGNKTAVTTPSGREAEEAGPGEPVNKGGRGEERDPPPASPDGPVVVGFAVLLMRL